VLEIETGKLKGDEEVSLAKDEGVTRAIQEFLKIYI
jgi:hypothetical protein